MRWLACEAVHTVALSGRDWLVATGVASVLLIGMEVFNFAGPNLNFQVCPRP